MTTFTKSNIISPLLAYASVLNLIQIAPYIYNLFRGDQVKEKKNIIFIWQIYFSSIVRLDPEDQMKTCFNLIYIGILSKNYHSIVK
jgi:hypothetical protein